MKIVPVLDVKAGRAVLARGGERAHYAPVRSILHEGSDPVALARAYRDTLGLAEVYLADLDAIGGAPPCVEIVRAIADAGLGAWVDAGVRAPGDAEAILGAGASAVVAGLETLDGPDAVAGLVARFGPDRVIFSLDLKAGRPLVATSEAWGSDDPRELAGVAIEAGIRRMILLDLARVGRGGGVGTEPLMRDLHAESPGVELIAGGGVAGPDDLRRLREAGASAALVGSALHDGRIGASAILAVGRKGRS